MPGRINFKFRTLETVAKAVQSASRVQKAAPLSTDQDALVEKHFGSRERFDAMVAAAAQKAAKKAFSIERQGDSVATQPAPLTCRDQGAQGSAGINGTPNGPVSKAVKAALRNDRVSRVDANNVRDFPGSPRGGDVLPPYNRPGQTATPASGGAIRDDGPAARTVADTAATHRRLAIDADVAEATGNLALSRKSGTLTREEIAAQERAIGCGNGATDAASVLAIMRANRARGKS